MSHRPSSPRIKRVPPPPPPGFGDEDYYRLYGRPEEYHQKRQKFERSERSPSFHEDHEEYYYYRRSRKSYEEEYDYYSRRSSNRPVHERLSKKRSYYNEVHGDPRPSTSQAYKNFQVDVDNESEGTPSLSGVDTDGGSKASSVDSDNSSNHFSDSDSESEERDKRMKSLHRKESQSKNNTQPRKNSKNSKSRQHRKKQSEMNDLYKNRTETYRENEMMQKKLDRKHKRTSVSDKNLALAKLAGIDMPTRTMTKQKNASRKPESSRLRIGGMESSTRDGKRSRILMSRSRSKSPAAGPSNNRKRKSRKDSSSPEKWSHDKFDSRDSNAEKDTSPASAFGSHWSQNRREKSKEKGSQSRKRSRRRQRSGSSSRSRSSSSHSSRSSSSSDRSIRRRRRRRRRSYSSSSVTSGSSRSSGSVRRQLRTHREERRKAEAKKQASEKARNNVPLVEREVPATMDDQAHEKEEVDMSLSGNLLKDTNTVNGVVVRYAEPTDARKPKTKWRMYVFKGEEELPILYVHRQSSYLLGRDRKVADIPLDHPSCSKQHAVLQYRIVSYQRGNGTLGRKVKPYCLDMNSANGTFVNNQRIEPQKYVELVEKDVLKFGFSSREYVLLHDKEDNNDSGVD